MKSRISTNFHMPINTLSSASPPRGHMGGGGGGTWSWDPGPPPWVRGFIYDKKNISPSARPPRKESTPSNAHTKHGKHNIITA